MQRRSSSARAVVIAWSFGGGGGRRFLHFPPLLQSIELASDRSTGSMKKGPAGFAFLRIGWPSEEELGAGESLFLIVVNRFSGLPLVLVAAPEAQSADTAC